VKTLLLADDSVTIQRVVALIFADEDVEVVTVSDGDQAIRTIESSPPDIVLADVGMPGRNGYEVARHIKGSPRLARIPVMLLTGAFEPADEGRIAESGCDGVLAKPFEAQEVIARVRELLDRRFAAEIPAAEIPGDESKEPARERLDSYFDKLDQDLTSLANASPESKLRPAASVPVRAQETMASSPSPRPLPALADAFAALLAAEQQDGTNGKPVWSASESAHPVVSDELVERVTERVIERLADRAIREAVDDIVSDVAERLVREEIARIKSSIK
jgi:CheY-like chemotaxis protein